MNSFDSVGTLLAAIANLINDGLRILSLADKRQWGPDEQEQVHALELLLDEAKQDFQELSPLVNGQIYYENDRKHESLEELRLLRVRFNAHIQDLRDWSRSGGPINPVWIRETQALQKELHRAQCRAARRIFTSEKEASARCLGAFLVFRKQRKWMSRRASEGEVEYQKRLREELVACNKIGTFERFGDRDVAFICDYCDGHMIWEDLESMPSIRTDMEAEPTPTSPTSPTLATSQTPQWQATGFTVSEHQEKQIVYAPVVIANHIAPQHADYIAGVMCPLCEELAGEPQEVYDEEDVYRPDNCFEDVAALQDHLEWEHSTASQSSALPVPGANNCLVM